MDEFEITDIKYVIPSSSMTGDQFHACIEIYKMYVETMERVMARRQIVSSFFLSVNVLLFTGIGFCSRSILESSFLPIGSILLSAIGISVCHTWYRLLVYYRRISAGKFAIIHIIEDNLPVRPFRGEQNVFVEHKIIPLSTIERKVPIALGAAHILILLLSLYLFVFII